MFGFLKIFIYLAALSLSWVTQDLLLQRAGSPVVAHALLAAVVSLVGYGSGVHGLSSCGAQA